LGVQIGNIAINNNYSSDVVIRLYHADALDRVFATWNYSALQISFLAMRDRRITIGGDWRIDIVFGNGVTSKAHLVREVGSYVGGAWNVDATRIYNGQ
jgi:hypothetical protein